MNIWSKAVTSVLPVALFAHGITASAEEVNDPSLVLHYRFDKQGAEVRDLSGYGNDGKITDGEFLEEVSGRKGVLRLNGSTSFVDCGSADSLQLEGDTSLTMWVRQNGDPRFNWGMLFGEHPIRSFHFSLTYGYGLNFFYRGPEFNATEAMMIPVPRRVLGSEWSHLSLVIESPRFRVYQNGELVADQLMPITGLAKLERRAKRIGGGKDNFAPIDLSEVRLYRRALTAEEISALAKGEVRPLQESAELATEPNWYSGQFTVRLTRKNRSLDGAAAEFILLENGKEVARETGRFTNASGNDSERYVATAAFPIETLEGKRLSVLARASGVNDISQEIVMEKPQWIREKAGVTSGVPAPWTPVEIAQKQGGTSVNVWGRSYEFGSTLLPAAIQAASQPLLKSPAELLLEIDGKPASWTPGAVEIEKQEKASVTLTQQLTSGELRLTIRAVFDYDGYITYDLELTSRTEVPVSRLALALPLEPEEATLAYGERVFDKVPGKAIAEWYSGAVTEPLNFRFSPNIWIGGNDRGLTWQAESNEFWHNADLQKAITITPAQGQTTLEARFIDTDYTIKPDRPVRYRFALMATPVKPLERDGWDLRIARYEPWGKEIGIAQRKMGDGTPEAKAIAAAGVRHVFTNVNDLWPWPMPSGEKFGSAVHQMVDTFHQAGLKTYNYAIHQRVPVNIPAFDLYGMEMSNRPLKQYVVTVSGNRERPGSLVEGADSQACTFMCAKSQALQDAFMDALKQRLATYKDDGVYLDGTVHIVPCSNEAHGCGYRAKDGSLQPTYPVFGVRELMQRIYAIVKERAPDAVVDVHCSFGYNPAGLAYADVMWTGEQWHHLRHTGTDYVANQLTLDKFRTEFTGRQLGIAAETLHYRLRNPMKIAATSLLHDISPRYSLRGFDNMTGKPDPYFDMVPKLWELRDRFGAQHAEKLFYWANSDYVATSGEQSYATLLKHPKNGTLALISNLSREDQEVGVTFNLPLLGLPEGRTIVHDAISGASVPISAKGEVKLALGSEAWTYLWLKPEGKAAR